MENWPALHGRESCISVWVAFFFLKRGGGRVKWNLVPGGGGGERFRALQWWSAGIQKNSETGGHLGFDNQVEIWATGTRSWWSGFDCPLLSDNYNKVVLSRMDGWKKMGCNLKLGALFLSPSLPLNSGISFPRNPGINVRPQWMEIGTVTMYIGGGGLCVFSGRGSSRPFFRVQKCNGWVRLMVI